MPPRSPDRPSSVVIPRGEAFIVEKSPAASTENSKRRVGGITHQPLAPGSVARLPLSEMGDLERTGSGRINVSGLGSPSRSSGSVEGLLDRKDSKGGIRNTAQQGQVALTTMLKSWVSRKFAVGCAILFPVVVTVYITWWFLQFFDSIFSPIYEMLFSFHVFGLGFITSMVFILGTGVFFSSWLGGALLGIGELLIRRLPLVKHIYSASKQVSAALNPENETAKAFQECCLIRHPRQGEWAFGFVTGKTEIQSPTGITQLLSVYVPTNHVYIGDVFLMEEKDVIHTNLSVREGLEVVISVGMAVPPTLIASRGLAA